MRNQLVSKYAVVDENDGKICGGTCSEPQAEELMASLTPQLINIRFGRRVPQLTVKQIQPGVYLCKDGRYREVRSDEPDRFIEGKVRGQER